MSYGMKLLDSTQTVTYDSSSQGGVFVEFLTIPTRTTNAVYNVEYPSLTGRNIYVMPVKAGDHTYKIYGPADTVPGFTSALGYPVLQYKQSSTLGIYGYNYTNPTILMVFVL